MLLPSELDIVEAGKTMPLPLPKPAAPAAVAAKGDGKVKADAKAKAQGAKPEIKPEAKKAAAPKVGTQLQPARTRPRL